MGNMAYCRFQNTKDDLLDCEENIHGECEDPEEERARKSIIRICKRIASDFEDEDNTP